MSMQTVYSTKNAGKIVKTRWGDVRFDIDGKGQINIPDSDVELLTQLNWHTDPTAARAAALADLKERAAVSKPVTTDSQIEIIVQSTAHANKTVKTRWGLVSFDSDGSATFKLPEADIPLIPQLRWTIIESSAKMSQEVGMPIEDKKKKKS